MWEVDSEVNSRSILVNSGPILVNSGQFSEKPHKTGPKLSKTVPKQCQTVPNRAKQPSKQCQTVPNSAKTVYFRVCSTTPRFSYSGPKTGVRAVPTMPVHPRRCRGTGTGGYTGWVYRVGAGRGNTGSPSTVRREVPGQRSGPRKPQGGWSGWSWGRNTTGRRRGRVPTPAGPGQAPLVPSLVPSQNAASWPITARFHYISYKLSQNGKVSLKYVEKACHAPYFQNGLEKSPLDFSRFPFSLAFSRKELIGSF